MSVYLSWVHCITTSVYLSWVHYITTGVYLSWMRYITTSVYLSWMHYTTSVYLSWMHYITTGVYLSWMHYVTTGVYLSWMHYTTTNVYLSWLRYTTSVYLSWMHYTTSVYLSRMHYITTSVCLVKCKVFILGECTPYYRASYKIVVIAVDFNFITGDRYSNTTWCTPSFQIISLRLTGIQSFWFTMVMKVIIQNEVMIKTYFSKWEFQTLLYKLIIINTCFLKIWPKNMEYTDKSIFKIYHYHDNCKLFWNVT